MAIVYNMTLTPIMRLMICVYWTEQGHRKRIMYIAIGAGMDIVTDIIFIMPLNHPDM